MSKLNANVLEGFVNSVLRKNFDRPVSTPSFHREMWQLVTSNSKQVAIAAPRHHAKSTAVTHAYTLASVLFRESRYVLIVSDTVTQAVQFLGDIKKELLDMKTFDLYLQSLPFLKTLRMTSLLSWRMAIPSVSKLRVVNRSYGD